MDAFVHFVPELVSGGMFVPGEKINPMVQLGMTDLGGGGGGLAPKVRIKLSMKRKLPTLANRKPGSSGLPHKKRKKDGAVKATVVDSGDEVDAVAAVVASASTSTRRTKTA